MSAPVRHNSMFATLISAPTYLSPIVAGVELCAVLQCTAVVHVNFVACVSVVSIMRSSDICGRSGSLPSLVLRLHSDEERT